MYMTCGDTLWTEHDSLVKEAVLITNVILPAIYNTMNGYMRHIFK